MSEPQATAKPLAGYRVVDLTTFLSGPFCTQILADLGADVVKIETPQGDSSRAIPPHFVGDDSAYYLGINRSKRSLAVDMKQPDGLALVLRLIATADVVVENYRPGVAARLGLDIAALRTERPGLIWASISGFGQTGPWRDKPAYDMIVQALSGVMSLTGEPGRPAVRLGIPAGDMVAGMYATIAINAALAERERSGQGRVIDVSMLDCQLAMLSYQSTYALVAGTVPQPQGARHDSIPTYRSFVARDGRELVVTANTERMWEGLCQGLDRAALLSDPRFATAKLRLANREALWPLLEEAFLARDAADWIAPLDARGVPVALIKTVPEALSDARGHGRGMILPLTDAAGTSIDVVGNPIKFVDETGLADDPASYPPVLGADAESVLDQWLGLGSADVRKLFDAKTLVRRTPVQDNRDVA
ncbi:CaiB/BaiF CoA transferase family protein [Azospirillum agricola]|uniref:CaiB/BaiF CoA transferase family protein n=1 Tax=Azospirillum agricola TaxID=1720247 RepID=UPI000A0F3F1F|nr:CoA transferase [Azospirillum agricola]SMH46688.1 Crotonobetainyl-CoA:carnitine CoA-transferase CaiB [Azospirillum lipoferum]